MSKVTFEEDELAVVALFQENTRKDTIDILEDTLEALEDDLLETITSAIGKLQMIEDKYYYSLELNRYLNNLEDDAFTPSSITALAPKVAPSPISHGLALGGSTTPEIIAPAPT